MKKLFISILIGLFLFGTAHAGMETYDQQQSVYYNLYTLLISNDLPELFTAVDSATAGSGILISSNDTTVGYLNGKALAGTGITFTEGNDGSNETLTLSLTTTAAVADMDIIDGISDSGSLTATELLYLDGVTASLSGFDSEAEIEAFIFDTDAENISAVWEIQDDTLFNFGADADFGIRYDETTDDQLEIVSNSGSDTEISIANAGAGDTNLTIDGDIDAGGDVTITGGLDIGSGTTKAVAPAGTFVTDASGYPVIDTSGFVISSLAEGAWKTLYPTGGSGDNEWDDLAAVPADADWIEVKVVGLSQGGDGQKECEVWAVEGDAVGPAPQDYNLIYRVIAREDDAGNDENAGGVTTHKLQLSSNNYIDIRWASDFDSDTVNMYLIGWGFNP